ncbi:hypothetical protein PoHVEF18_006911 [Penicillium ochrochloron]
MSSSADQNDNYTVKSGLTEMVGKTFQGSKRTVGNVVSGLGATIGGAGEGVGQTATGAAQGLGSATKGLGQSVNQGFGREWPREVEDEWEKDKVD